MEIMRKFSFIFLRTIVFPSCFLHWTNKKKISMNFISSFHQNTKQTNQMIFSAWCTRTSNFYISLDKMTLKKTQILSVKRSFIIKRLTRFSFFVHNILFYRFTKEE